MNFVAVAALLMFGLRTLSWLAEAVDDFDEPFAATKTTRHAWSLGPTPSVVVDCSEGSIQVVPSSDGQVRAEITAVSSSQSHRSWANEGLSTIRVQCDYHGDTSRISIRAVSDTLAQKDTLVALSVPSNVRLDLRTGRGAIRVGWIFGIGVSQRTPIVAASIRARNDSYNLGDITIATQAPTGPDGMPIPTRLSLDASGVIKVTADLATIEAYAWQGSVDRSQWQDPSHEQRIDSGGSISLEGTIVGASNTIRAAHEIDLQLAGSLRIDAQAPQGNIFGNLIPPSVDGPQRITKWNGTIGSDSGTGSMLRLQLDGGQIRLDSKP